MKKILTIVLSSLIIASCSSESENKVESATIKENPIETEVERFAEINKHSEILFSDSLNFNAKSANDLLAAYEAYIEFHSFQSKSKTIQFKAGELAKSLNKPHVAIAHFNGLLERDPTHEKAGLAMFYKAMIIGDMLHENELAKKTYQEFIDTYPNHPFVESAKASIILQGKSLNDIVKEFEQKNS